MRNELEIIEKIERYIKGELSAEERTAFEQELATDAELQQKVALQREVMSGIERIAIKEQIEIAGKQYAVKNKLLKFGLGGAGLLLLLASWYFVGRHTGHSAPYDTGYNGTNLPAYNETGGTNWASADSNLKAQVFYLDASKDTVIETEQGIVISIPANGFLDKNEQTVKGEYMLYVKEALDAASIMKAGLCSMSGSDLLESAGMFFVDVRKDGEQLVIDSNRALYARIPAKEIRPGMQLFKGQRQKDGTIDWTTPKPIIHELMTTDILSLDFYPPYYLAHLSDWGYNSGDKKFTDSLYYSLAAFFSHYNGIVIDSISEMRLNNYQGSNVTGNNIADDIEEAPKLPPGKEYDDEGNVKPVKSSKSTANSNRNIQRNFAKSDRNASPAADTNTGATLLACGINPAKVKAIWSRKLNNTILATKEFEERIKVIHETYRPALLDLYVKGLNKSMYELDSMAALIAPQNMKAKFEEFAGRHDGKVGGGQIQLQKLSDYYEMKTKAITAAVAKTEAELAEQQANADKKKAQFNTSAQIRSADDSIREFVINLKEAYRQLGYGDVNTVSIVPPSRGYIVPVTTTGWNNVDRYVFESTENRTTLDYTDKKSGEGAVIRYKPFSVKLENTANYDRVYAYLLPAELNSFVRLTNKNDLYTYKLNELIKYKLVCIGWKGEQGYYYEKDGVKPGNYNDITLTPIKSNDLDKRLNHTDGLKEQLYYLGFEHHDAARRKPYEDWEALRLKVFRMISPCYGFSESAVDYARK